MSERLLVTIFGIWILYEVTLRPEICWTIFGNQSSSWLQNVQATAIITLRSSIHILLHSYRYTNLLMECHESLAVLLQQTIRAIT